MANILPTTSIVAKEILAILQNSRTFIKKVNRDYQDEYGSNMSRGYEPGQTINIKRPPRFTWRAGRVASPQDVQMTTSPLTLAQGGTELNFTSFERTVQIAKFDKVMMAAAAAVMNEIDRQGLDLARRTALNAVGTPGTYPSTQATAYAMLTGANQKLDEMGCPLNDGNRSLIMNSAMNSALLQGTGGLFNAAPAVSKGYTSGRMVDSFGFDMSIDQNVSRHTNGTQAVAALTVNGAGQTGSVLTVAATSGTITQGTTFTLGVNAVNPQSRQDTAALQQFTVTSTVASGATTMNISPAIIPSGAFQNVTVSPSNGAVVTILGTASGSYDANVVFHQDAFTLAMVPMNTPEEGTGAKVTQMSDDGYTIKVTKVYDGINDNNIMRLDVLYGFAATYPELACKLVA
jgi:hypothetical protein